jgi:hypothetical protein
MGCVYDNSKTKYLKELVISEFNKFDNLNYFLGRVNDYNPNGRMQTYEEALEKDREIKEFMIDNEIEYTDIPAEEESVKLIVEDIKRKLSYEKV